MTAFDWLEWDQDRLTGPIMIGILETGSLPSCIETLQIQRTKDLAITATAVIEGYFVLDEKACKENCGGSVIGYFKDNPLAISPRVVLKNIRINSSYTNIKPGYDGNQEYTSTLKFSIGKVEIFFSDLEIDRHIIWLTGFSGDSFHLTRSTTRKYDNSFELIRDKETVKKYHFPPQPSSRLDYSMLHISKNETEFDFILGYVLDEISDSDFKCGYIEFSHEDHIKMTNSYSEDFIIDALSYIFGVRLVYAGKTLLDKHRDRIEISTISLQGALLGSRSWPPSINYNLLDERLVSYQVSQLLDFFDKNSVRHSLFLAWLGLNSPIEVSAIHLGAAIESLRDTIINSKDTVSTKNTVSTLTKLFSDKIWKENLLSKLYQAFLDGSKEIKEKEFSKESLEILEKNLEILERNIKQLNGKSSGMKYEDFLNLSLSSAREK